MLIKESRCYMLKRRVCLRMMIWRVVCMMGMCMCSILVMCWMMNSVVVRMPCGMRIRMQLLMRLV